MDEWWPDVSSESFQFRVLSDRHGVVRARSRGAVIPQAFVEPASGEFERQPGRLLVVSGGLPAGALVHVGRGRHNPPVLIELKSRWLARASIGTRPFLPAVPWSAVEAVVVDCEDNADLVRSDIFADCVPLRAPIRVDPLAFTDVSGRFALDDGEIFLAEQDAFDRALAGAIMAQGESERAVLPPLLGPDHVAAWAVESIELRQELLGLPRLDIASRFVTAVLRRLLDQPAPCSATDLAAVCRTVGEEAWATSTPIEAWLTAMAGANAAEEHAVADLRMSDGRSILLRALMLAVLRDSRERILGARSDSLLAGDAVVSAALLFHGLMVGLGGVDGRVKESSLWLDRCWEGWIDARAASRDGSRFESSLVAGTSGETNMNFALAVKGLGRTGFGATDTSGFPESCFTRDAVVSAISACGLRAIEEDQPLLGSDIVALGSGVTVYLALSGETRELCVTGPPALKGDAVTGWAAVADSKSPLYSRRALLGLLEAVSSAVATPFIEGTRVGFRLRVEHTTSGLSDAVAQAVSLLRKLGWSVSQH